MSEWIIGRQPVYETLRAGKRSASRAWLARKKGTQHSSGDINNRLFDIQTICSQKQIPVEYVSHQQLDVLGSGHQGIALQVSAYPYADFGEILEVSVFREQMPFILVLDTLQDPQNFGTLLRTAEAVGVHGVLLPLRRTVTVTPAVVSASSGASEHMLIAQYNLAQALEIMKREGIWILGLDMSEKANYPHEIDLNRPLALIVGSEGAGIHSLVRDSCDILMKLPMRGQIESLNAATAGSVALYLSWQARGFGLQNSPGVH